MAGTPGIYCILHRKSGDCYVGQATSIADRFTSHKQMLRAGVHHSKRLQADFDCDGLTAFAFQAMEYCDPADLDGKEYDWIVKLRPPYNTMVPDYAALATGRQPEKRLRRVSNPDRKDPSRFLCPCGNLKSLGSRWCLGCAGAKLAEMQAAGYLPADRDWDEEAHSPGSSPESLSSFPAGANFRSRLDYALDPNAERVRPDPVAELRLAALKAVRDRGKRRKTSM